MSPADPLDTPAPAAALDSPRAFEYLLNALERAGQEEEPSQHGYAAKRRAIFAYVDALRTALSQARADTRRMNLLDEFLDDLKWEHVIGPKPAIARLRFFIGDGSGEDVIGKGASIREATDDALRQLDTADSAPEASAPSEPAT